MKSNIRKFLIVMLLIYIIGLTLGLVYLIFLGKLQLGFYSVIRLISCLVIPIGSFSIVFKINEGLSQLKRKGKALVIVFMCIIFILLIGGLYSFMYENIQQIRSLGSTAAILGSYQLIYSIDLYIKKKSGYEIVV